jgi:hypothetical protein
VDLVNCNVKVLAATNKCLAKSDKSRTGGEATKERLRRPFW